MQKWLVAETLNGTQNQVLSMAISSKTKEISWNPNDNTESVKWRKNASTEQPTTLICGWWVMKPEDKLDSEKMMIEDAVIKMILLI